MSFLTAKIELEQYFAANYSGTPVEYENAPLSDFSNLTEWVRFITTSASASQMSFGLVAYRYTGVIAAQIFIKPDIGSRRAYEISDLISNVFKSKVIGSYVFKVPEAIVVGESEGWYQVNLIIPFWRQE